MVYTSPIVRIGSFRCPASHPAWLRENRIDSGPLVVFPRVPVRIKHADKSPVVANANCVMLYNANQTYKRALLDRRGDACEFFEVNEQILADIVSEYEPPVRDRPKSPFRDCSGPSEARHYLAQRRVFDYVTAADEPDRLLVDEMSLEVIRQVVALLYKRRGCAGRSQRVDTDRCHRDAAEAAKELIGSKFTRRLTLNEVAERVHLSPFHLCRVFRRFTGFTLHQYLTQLRLRISLEMLFERPTDLTSLALRLGFSSHSHFTSTFQKAFGVCPTRVRDGSSLKALQFKQARF